MAIERSDIGKTVQSPCVRNCCLDDDDVCLGCFRTLAEICGWQDASDDERRAIIARCAEREWRKKNAARSRLPEQDA